MNKKQPTPAFYSSFIIHRSSFFSLITLVLVSSFLHAHPVPSSDHDRTIVVHLSEQSVKVDYRLELDESTAFRDLAEVIDRVDSSKLDRGDGAYDAFTQSYAPILADNLVAELNRKPLTFKCTKREHRLKDEEGKPLGHLRCDFIFQAPWPQRVEGQPRFTFREGNYEYQTGLIRLSFAAAHGIQLQDKSEPDRGLQELARTDLKPGDEPKLRNASAMIIVKNPAAMEPASVIQDKEPDASPSEPPSNLHRSLASLLLENRYGCWLLLILAGAIGAVHALTPGHGKTLVAAYLVGEQGTAWHAVVLGIVTTLTHTGMVLIIALVLWQCYPGGKISDSAQRNLHTALGMGGGLLVAFLGLWLLLRRLAGQADHFHIGGSHHHHGHSHDADHEHDEHGVAHTSPRINQTVGWWGLVVLGMSGGIVPCWDAVAMLILAVAMNLIWLALPLLLAFSAGLAGVLVLIGIMVVHVKGFAGSHFGSSRLFRALPMVSAALVTCLGLWLCYDSVPR